VRERVPLEHSAVPLREPVYARYASLFDYWLMLDKKVNGRRFVIEQHGIVRDWADPLAYGTDYVVDGVYVSSQEFDRILRLEGVP
jgi:hypothetical protein